MYGKKSYAKSSQPLKEKSDDVARGVSCLTFLAFCFDRRRGVAVFADTGVSDGSHTVLVLLTLHQIRNRRRLTDDRRVLHLLPAAERRPLLQLVAYESKPHSLITD